MSAPDFSFEQISLLWPSKITIEIWNKLFFYFFLDKYILNLDLKQYI